MWGYLAWIELTEEGWLGREARVVSQDLRKVPGEDYSRVPRRSVGGPRDPFDPRDPYYERRKREWEPPGAEPDF